MMVHKLFLAFLLLLFWTAAVCTAAEDSGRQPTLAEPKDDPFFKALDALKDKTQREKIEEACIAFFSSDFARASTLFEAILSAYPEPSLGGELYESILLFHGTSLGFSGRHEESITRLDALLDRYEADGASGKRGDALAVAALKIDIIELTGDAEAKLRAIDAVLEKFGGNKSKAANYLGISRFVLHRRLQALEKEKNS